MPLLAALLAVLAAFLSYRFLEEWTSKSWLPAALRAAGWGTLALLLVNASCPAARPSARPLVLLDGSLSMQAAGGRWEQALTLARRSGEVRLVGPAAGDTLPSAGRSRLAAAITAAASAGRRVILVSDGEIEDAEDLPSDSLLHPEIHVLRRREVPDVALVRVTGPARLTPGDSLALELEVQSFGMPAGKRWELEAREGSRVWMRGNVAVDAAGRGTATLHAPLPAVPPGAHVLRIALTNAADAEPRDDARLLVVTIVPTPGVVLLASPPGWESKFLLETLRATTALPVRGYLETERGVWRRAGDLRVAPSNEVADAARRADLLVTVGAANAMARGSRARGRWSWPAAGTPGQDGDWYVSAPGSTPLSAAFLGVSLDSFPPGTAVTELGAPAGSLWWIGLTAQAGRRGAVRPVLVGRDSARVRQLVTGIDGLWRWSFRGGSSEQGYRALVATGAAWLLGGADSLTGKARLQRDVVARGLPVVFEWAGSGAAEPVVVEWSGAGTRRDTLVFDGAGHAEVLLPPGVWTYRLAGGGSGTLAVEEYSEEWLPRRVALADRSGGSAPAAEHFALRSWVWVFGIAAAAFAGEWFVRRRFGLR